MRFRYPTLAEANKAAESASKKHGSRTVVLRCSDGVHIFLHMAEVYFSPIQRVAHMMGGKVMSMYIEGVKQPRQK